MKNFESIYNRYNESKGKMTVEEAKIFVSKQLQPSPIEAPIRTALFQCVSDSDWKNKIIPLIYSNFPEISIEEEKK